MEQESRVYVAGVDTIIGRALFNELQRQGYVNVLGGTDHEPDLTDHTQTFDFFSTSNPEYVFLTAGKSGGILANQKYPADFLIDNLLIECNVVQAAQHFGVNKLMLLASSCSYPRDCPQPMRVESLLTGPLEPTNQAYAISKIAGIALCQAYREQYGVNFVSAIPSNYFGPGDDFSQEDSHVIAALMRRMHDAKRAGTPSIEIWGTGTPRREFIYVDDLADACIFAMCQFNGEQPINLGGGLDLSIGELAERIKGIVEYPGELKYDTSRPDGMPLKALDSSELAQLGWQPRTSFQAALEATYQWFLQNELAWSEVNVQ